MKLREGFILRQVAGENVVLSVSADVDLNGMITLNDTGCTLWKRLEQVLTDFEVSCLRCHLEGYSYEESAVALRTDSKAVDNALQRARRKLRKRLGAQPDFFRFDR